MKKLTLIFTLLFSTVIFSSPSYAEWTKVGGDSEPDPDYKETHYINFAQMIRYGDYSFYLELSDWKSPIRDGIVSITNYVQVNCKSFSFRDLSALSFTNSMGQGEGTPFVSPYTNWTSVNKYKFGKKVIQLVCNR